MPQISIQGELLLSKGQNLVLGNTKLLFSWLICCGLNSSGPCRSCDGGVLHPMLSAVLGRKPNRASYFEGGCTVTSRPQVSTTPA